MASVELANKGFDFRFEGAQEFNDVSFLLFVSFEF